MPISPPPVREWRPGYVPAYLSNGLIGLRAGPIPLIEGLAIVNGLAQVDPVEMGEGFARGPYPVGGDITVDGDELSGRREQAHFVEQGYDFSSGELTSRFGFDAGQVHVDVVVLTICSRSLPSVVLQEVRATVDRPCRLTLTARVDPRGLDGRWLSRSTRIPDSDEEVVDGFLHWETHGALSTCGAAYVTRFDGGDGVERWRAIHDELAPLATSYAVDARPGRDYVLHQFASLIPSQLHHEPDRQAVRLATMAAQRGFERLREENRAAWDEIWKGRVKLVGAGRDWQALADAAFYYLHASAHASSIFSTSMFGLAYWPNYHYYRGHVMWDIETFAYPTLLLTAPQAAHGLLRYRLERLRAARHNAAQYGYRGLQFPWASGPRHGEEVIRLSAPRIVFEQHVSLSVAHAFAQYANVTGDEEFLADEAWPVLQGVAEWLDSRAVRTERGYEIREAIGIAEQTEPVDNNAYVNMAARVVLGEAAGAARRLGRPVPRSWLEMAERLVLPIDERRVIRNHDGFTGHERDLAGATPEALAGLFPFGHPVDEEVERATTRFYLRRAQRFVGNPMLSAILGVHAARIGDRSLALQLFQSGYADFVQEPFLETNEFSVTRFPDKPRVGPFMANLGGFLLSLFFGLPGLDPSPDDPATWFARPVVLPEAWDAIEVDRVHVRGATARLVARQGDRSGRFEF